ncbi:MAG: tRNA (N(6)-L-threonylcarbamoyladenosine(37)-C(2))-methylthiotransferase [Nanoarchaeota archaeon]
MASAYIQTYGCSANQNNSEIVAGLLARDGNTIANDVASADAIIINTCTVKEKTTDKIKRRIQDLQRLFPNKKMIVTGCMAQTDGEKIKKLNRNAIIVGTDHYTEIPSMLNESPLISIRTAKQKEEKILLPKIFNNNLIAIAQISEGCVSNCTFCKTKIAKGNLQSYPQEKILQSITQDLQNGAQEVWLTSQGNENYGMDQGKNKLSELLKNILALPFDFKLRIGMMNPINFPIDDLITIYKHPKIYKFLHLPIQSASNRILKDMKRGYTIEKAEKIIKTFKKRFPHITFATDIITGYPTENEEDHQKNLQFIQTLQPDILNLSKFSKHKGTQADALKNLPIKIVNQRNTEIMRLHRQTTAGRKRHYLNKIIEVFINTKKGNNFYEARDENYNIILISSLENILGKTIHVKIINTGVHHMIGEKI